MQMLYTPMLPYKLMLLYKPMLLYKLIFSL